MVLDAARTAERWSPRAVVVGVVLAVVTTLVAIRDTPGEVDVAVFRWFNDPPGVLGFVLGWVEPLLRPAALTLLVAVVLVTLAVVRPAGAWQLVLSASAAAALAYVVVKVLKLVVDRGRPPAYLEDVLFHGYPVDPRGSGFPSSHTAVTVALVRAEGLVRVPM